MKLLKFLWGLIDKELDRWAERDMEKNPERWGLN